MMLKQWLLWLMGLYYRTFVAIGVMMLFVLIVVSCDNLVNDKPFPWNASDRPSSP